jgi:uncharacterized membrane protein
MTTTNPPSDALPETSPGPEARTRPRRLHRPETVDLAPCVGWSVVAILLIFSGLQAWAGQLQFGLSLVTAAFLILSGLSSLVVIWSRFRVERPVQIALFVGAAVGFAIVTTMVILHDPTYGTDEIAFDQYAAQLALHGIDPYLRSMGPALGFFHVPDIYRTYLMTGGQVTRLSYPAGSFLVYLPILALGMHMQTAILVDGLAWISGMVLAWRLLPQSIGWVAPLLLLGDVYMGYTAGGVTDTLYVPLLVLAMWQWDRFADPTEPGRARWIGPVALGLACTVKQTPWFLVPFLVIAIYLEAQVRGAKPVRVAAQYLLLVAIPFVVVNFYYIVRAPGAWLHSVLLPLTAQTEPAGEGLVAFTIFQHAGGQLIFYTVAGIAAFVACVFAFVGWYGQLKRAWLFLLVIAFFWPTRSLGEYLIMLLPAAIVGAVTVRQGGPAGWRPARYVAGVGALATLGLAALALTLPPSLSLRVLGEHSTGALQTVDQLTLRVTNHSNGATSPLYAVTPTGQISSFWERVGGPSSIAPHSSAVVTLVAPNFQSMPPIVGGFIVDALTAHPSQLATTSEVRLDQLSTFLNPEGIEYPIPLKKTVTFTVQVVDKWGNPVNRAGIVVNLGQTVYAQYGLEAGEASIDGLPEGQSPVAERTNRSGKATFTVRAVQIQSSQVFLQSWIARTGVPPSGYSNVVSLEFKSSS